MRAGGSVPYALTIYANAFRVADKILSDRGEVLQSNKKKSPATFMQQKKIADNTYFAILRQAYSARRVISIPVSNKRARRVKDG
jgi:hypothetical protein